MSAHQTKPVAVGMTVTIMPRKLLDSAVMTTRAKSRISHGLLVVVSLLTDPSADVALVLIVLLYHMYSSLTDS
jgi:hypothetical protein